MKTTDIRRLRLKEWYSTRSIPESEKSYISQLINGKASFGEKAARRLENDYQMPSGYLDSTDNLKMSSNVESAPDLIGSVPLISWVQAGNWENVIDNLAPGEGERIQTTYKAKKHTYALRVRGDSMEPKFPSGCIIIVEPEQCPTSGQYVIVRQNGDEATFKQYIEDGSSKYLKPLNDRYPIMEMRKDAVFCGVIRRMEMDI